LALAQELTEEVGFACLFLFGVVWNSILFWGYAILLLMWK